MGLDGLVTELLRREAEVLAALKDLLVQEHAAVQVRDGAALQRAAEDKRLLIEQLERFSKDRSGLMTAHRLTNDRAGFESLLARLEGSQRAAAEALWASVQETLEACHKQNQVNGLLLDTSLRTTHEVLGILLGHAREGNTYNSQGALSSGRGATRTYAKA